MHHSTTRRTVLMELMPLQVLVVSYFIIYMGNIISSTSMSLISVLMIVISTIYEYIPGFCTRSHTLDLDFGNSSHTLSIPSSITKNFFYIIHATVIQSRTPVSFSRFASIYLQISVISICSSCYLECQIAISINLFRRLRC